MTTIVDSFDRADSATSLGTTSDGLATWTSLSGTEGISSNQAYCPTLGAQVGGTYGLAYIANTADGDVQVTVNGTGGSGPAYRIQDVNNFWFVRTTADASGGLWVMASGSLIHTQTYSGWATGDVVRVEFSGSAITVKRNGSTVITDSEGLLSAFANVGLFFLSTADRLNDFATDFTPPIPPPIPKLVVAQKASLIRASGW